MPNIHPTAVVDPAAQLADDVTVGPHCVIESNVTLGPGTHLINRVSIAGPTTVGSNCIFYPGASIGYAPQHRGYDPKEPGAGLIIGNDSIFREGCTVHRGATDQPTRIGDRCYLMSNTHAGHDTILGNDVTLASGALLGGHVEIGDNVFIGGNAGIHQFTRIGRLSIISGSIGVHHDVPPFCLVSYDQTINSLNLPGLRRNGLRDEIRPLAAALRVAFSTVRPNKIAGQAVIDQFPDSAVCQEFGQFLIDNKRGILPARLRKPKK